MKILRIIFILAVMAPFFSALSGCGDDSFLDAMKEEEDFIAPFDVVLPDGDAVRTTYFKVPGLNTKGNYTVNPDTTPGTAAEGAENVVRDNVTGLMWSRCSAYLDDPDGTPGNGDESYKMDTTAGCTKTSAAMEWIYAAEFCKIKMNGIDASGKPTLPAYAGYRNWRLPRVPELMSIINFDNSVTEDPQIEKNIFPGTVNTQDHGYWTFTSKLFIGDYFETIDYGWIVYFKQSDPGFQSGAGRPKSVDFKRKLKEDMSFEKQHVRCVRGGIEDPD